MKKILLANATMLALASCNTIQMLFPTNKTLYYSWYDYEDIAYEYNKEPIDKNKEAMMKTLLKMSEEQKGTRGTVPPGFNADMATRSIRVERRKRG